MTITGNMLCKKGSAQAFTANGETISAQYLPKRRAWYVAFSESTLDNRNRNFPTAADAAAYITQNANDAKTQELKWWGR